MFNKEKRMRILLGIIGLILVMVALYFVYPKIQKIRDMEQQYMNYGTQKEKDKSPEPANSIPQE